MSEKKIIDGDTFTIRDVMIKKGSSDVLKMHVLHKKVNENQHVKRLWTSYYFRRVLRRGFGRIVCKGNDVVGFIVFKKDAELKVIEVCNICVAEGYQGKGIGRMLMGLITGTEVRDGFDSVVLQVLRSNEGAIRFYEKIGFEEKRVLEDFYPDEIGVEMVLDI